MCRFVVRIYGLNDLLSQDNLSRVVSSKVTMNKMQNQTVQVIIRNKKSNRNKMISIDPTLIYTAYKPGTLGQPSTNISRDTA